MAIYDIYGNELSSAYDIEGNELDSAYDLSGDLIFSKTQPVPPSWDYDDYDITDLYNKSASGLSGSSFQAFDIYNGVIAQVRHSSYLCLIDLLTGNTINGGMTCQVGHGNSFSFSRQFYADGDEFPISYATDGYRYVYINRVTRNGCTLLKTYKTNYNSYGGYLMGAVPSSDGKTLYTLGYTFEDYTSDREGTNLVKIATWNMENETDNGDGTYIPQFVSEITMPFIDCIQGCQLYDDLIFASSGINGRANQNVYLIDPSTAEIKHTISMGGTSEIEGCAWINNDYLLVGQGYSTIAYKKVTFAELTDEEES